MIVEVLKNLPQKDLLSCFNVCTLWRDLINQVIGLELHIGKGNKDIWKNVAGVRFRNIESISKFGITDCAFSELEYRKLSEIPVFEYPTMVINLWIDGFLTPAMYNKLVLPLTNLRYLAFHVSTLAILPLEGLCLNFENLRHLMISMVSITYNDHPTNNLVITNVLHLMQQPFTFVKLENLELHLPFFPSNAIEITQAIEGFTLRHKLSLRHLTVNVERNSSIGVTDNPSQNHGQTVHPEITGVNLSSCILECVYPNHPCMENLQRIMNSQLYLKSMYCVTGYKPLTEFGGALQKSFRTLTSIQISISSDISGDGVDLQHFASCTSLKLLGLLGPNIEDENPNLFEEDEDEIDGQMLTPNIKRAGFLPQTLEILKIFNLFLTTTDAGIITRKPNLRVLYLKNVGRYGDLGLLYSDAVAVLAKKTLKTINWTLCLNVKSVSKTPPEVDYKTFFFFIVLRHVQDGSFSIHWDEKKKTYLPGVSPTEPEILKGDHKEFVLEEDIFLEAEADADVDEDVEDDEDDDEELDVDEQVGEDDDDEELEVDDQEEV